MIEAGERHDWSPILSNADTSARAAATDVCQGQPRGAAKGASARGPEAARHGDQQLVLLAALRGRAGRDTRPARNTLQLDAYRDARRRGYLPRVARQPVGDVDHGACPTPRQPTPGGDARHGAGEAAPHAGSETTARAQRREREPRASKAPSHPQPVTGTRAAPSHPPLGHAEHADIHAIARGAYQVAP